MLGGRITAQSVPGRAAPSPCTCRPATRAATTRGAAPPRRVPGGPAGRAVRREPGASRRQPPAGRLPGLNGTSTPAADATVTAGPPRRRRRERHSRAPAPHDGAPANGAAANVTGAYGPHAGLNGRRVLVVDDDLRNVFAITSVLELYGLTVVHAPSGQQGIDTLRADQDIDLVLMDVMMPEMDGYTTTAAIRKMPEFADLPVIAVTARAMQGDRDKSLAAGATDYVTKPVDTEELLGCIKRWLPAAPAAGLAGATEPAAGRRTGRWPRGQQQAAVAELVPQVPGRLGLAVGRLDERPAGHRLQQREV